MRKAAFFILVFLVIIGCKEATKVQLSEGIWVAELEVMDKEILPFNFKLLQDDAGAYSMEVYNAEEVITVDEIVVKEDSIHIKMPVYEGYLVGTFTATTITGDFIKESLDRVVPFTATYGKEVRFNTSATAATHNVSGIWETTFEYQTAKPYIAKGIFTQNEDKVTGTFRTTTGDYRYLEGRMDGDSLKLSAFDGAHAFLFTARVTDSTLDGAFYSGNHAKELFRATRNEAFELPDADSLTFIKKGYDKFAFRFPDTEGTLVSLDDPEFKDKVVLVQIMGSWCPNCLDETRFYQEYLTTHNLDNLKVVGLAFEYAKTEAQAFKAISRLKERIGVSYPILLAQYGTSDKEKAQEKLPMLNHVLSYPTTIYIDKKGEVRKIHTGFNGPATGEKYVAFQREFKAFVGELLAE